MNQVKCECGHVNPPGTILCESCGKILVESEEKKKVLDMRYEGTARRSQTYNRTLVDKIWNFFSSVKVAVAIIVVTLIASAIGTFLPQESTLPLSVSVKEYYESEYGFVGRLFYALGFHNLYGSWWYMLLIALIGVSLVICSLDRVVPLYKALKKQRVTRHAGFLKRQRLFSSGGDIKELDAHYELLKERLRKRHYKVLEENGNLMAEKGRFSRWGPYVNHLGLIIFLIGVMLRFVPGMYVDESLTIKEGETKAIPGTNKQYYLKNHAFIVETYDPEKDKAFEKTLKERGPIVKNYQTNVTLYKAESPAVAGEQPKLEKVKDYQIRVNQPLKFDHYSVYQSGFLLNEISAMTFALADKKTGKEFGTFRVDLERPQKKYDLQEGYSVEILSYFPDFVMGEDGEPTSKSQKPNNPAFVFKMVTPDKPDGEISFVAIQQNLEPDGNNQYQIKFKSVETVNYSGLTVRKDHTLWILAVGGLIFMIGVIQGSYWNHRRIWIQRVNSEVWISAHTNKNWFSLQKEIARILEGIRLPVPQDQLKDGNKRNLEGVLDGTVEQ